MEKKKYIIWDWNGTLLNDVDLCIDAINRLLKKEQLPILKNKEAYQKVFKFPIIEYYKDAGFDFAKRSFQDLAQEYMSYYQPRSLSCPLHEGVKDTLKTCHELGYTQVLLSASKRDFLLEQVDKYDISHYFSEILGLDNVHAYSKAEIAKDFAKRTKGNAQSMVFLGDSVHDFEVAQVAGAKSVLIANGHEHKDKLVNTGARVIDDITQFTRHLQSKA